AYAHCAQLEAPDIQDVEGNQMSAPDFTKNVLHRHLAIIQNDWACRGATYSHFVLFRADREPRKTALHQEGCEPLAIDFGEDGKQVSEAGICDPHLFAVQDEVLSVYREHGTSAAIQRV